MIRIRIKGTRLNSDVSIAQWLNEHGIKNTMKNYNIEMIGIAYRDTGDIHFEREYCFADHCDTRVLTEFALRFGG